MNLSSIKGVAFALAAVAAVASGAARADEGKPAAPAAETLRLYVVVYEAGPAWKKGAPMSEQGLRPHGEYYKQRVAEGRIVGAGRFEATDGGMAIFRAASLEEAESVVAADPAVTGGIFTAELHVWTPRFFDDALAAAAAGMED